jgi:sec-independent protein translocase protein TatA
MLGNIGPLEMILIFVLLLLVFGAKRLPELGAGLGKGIREFKKSMNEINSEIEKPVEKPRVEAPKDDA